MKIKKKDLKILIENFLFEEKEEKETHEEKLKKDLKDIDTKEDPGVAYDMYQQLSLNDMYKNIEHDVPQLVKDYFQNIKLPEEKIPDKTTFSDIAKNISGAIKSAQANFKKGGNTVV